MNHIAITLDTDWASKEIIEIAAEILIANNVKATWFVTDEAALDVLSKAPELFQLGLHPNFEKNSTQGKTTDEVFTFLKQMMPDANTMRTHKLLQSTPILVKAAKDYGIKTDLSLLLWRTKDIAPHKIFMKEDVELTRFPYFWEDDVEMHCPSPSFEFNLDDYDFDGLKIFNFHPIHIALNSNSMSNYNELATKHDITKLELKDIKPFVFQKTGTKSFFNSLVEHMKNDESSKDPAGYTISDLEKLLI